MGIAARGIVLPGLPLVLLIPRAVLQSFRPDAPGNHGEFP